jgi:hypothetical protein
LTGLGEEGQDVGRSQWQGISGRMVDFEFLDDLNIVFAITITWVQLGKGIYHFLFFPIQIAYCQVSTGRGSEERPTGFPSGLERLLQNGEFPGAVK